MRASEAPNWGPDDRAADAAAVAAKLAIAGALFELSLPPVLCSARSRPEFSPRISPPISPLISPLLHRLVGPLLAFYRLAVPLLV